MTQNQYGPFMKERLSLEEPMVLVGLFVARPRTIILATLRRALNMGSVLSPIKKAKFSTKAYSTTKV